MFIAYIKERKAWLLFFLSLQIWLNIILTLDVAFLSISLLYINVINSLAFILFFIWRYRVESVFLKSLEVNIDKEFTLDMLFSALPEGKSTFEKRLSTALDELFEVAKEELNNTRVEHLEENDRTLTWIHEVKTPLTSMKLMIDTVENPKVKTKLEVEWLRIHLLLDQQLHHTRLPSLEKDYLIETTNFNKVIPAEIKELQAWCMQKGIGFEIDLLQEEVLTDQKWLSFIVRQLLSNAVKYSKENGEIHVYTQKDSSKHSILYIQDFGIGISPADLPRIFEKSFTGTTGRETTASTGMGLYLAKNAADKLGIEIAVESKIDKGSLFSLKFPIKNEMTRISGR